MRPRPECRGERRVERCRRMPSAASMRPRPEFAVENAGRPTCASADRRLQCGHDEFAVENGRARGAIAHRRDASMRPRRIRRGERAAAELGRGHERASMRPRRIRRGERCDHACRAQPTVAALQCGHDEFAVENYSSMRSRSAGHASMRPRPEGRGEPATSWRDRLSDELQCGHGPKTVENQMKVGQRHVSFNAATARRPWRTSMTTVRQELKTGFNAATARRPWRTSGSLSVRALRGFNAATALKTVENHIRVKSLSILRRFNAATARRPWRTA